MSREGLLCPKSRPYFGHCVVGYSKIRYVENDILQARHDRISRYGSKRL